MLHVFLATALVAVPQQQFDTTFAVRSGGRLEIENHQGDIVVRGWDRNEMRIRARIDGNGRVEVDRSGSRVQVEARSRRGLPGRIAYEISVPNRFDVTVEAINSSIELTGIEGDLRLETVNGAVTLTGVTGSINAESTQGRIRVRDSNGDLHVETVNQGIEVAGHSGDVHAETVNGEVRLSGIRSRSVVAETVNGAVEYGGEINESGRYVLSTHNGGILLYVPANANASVAVETYRGEIDSEFPIEIRGRSASRELQFDIGRGGARIELTSFGGNIRLRRAGR